MLPPVEMGETTMKRWNVMGFANLNLEGTFSALTAKSDGNRFRGTKQVNFQVGWVVRFAAQPGRGASGNKERLRTIECHYCQELGQVIKDNLSLAHKNTYQPVADYIDVQTQANFHMIKLVYDSPLLLPH